MNTKKQNKPKATQQKGITPASKDLNKDEQEIVERIERLEPKERQKVIQTITVEQGFSGPIPHPSHLAQYEQILPGAADRILKMAETQELHRHNLETITVEAGVKDSKRGQYLGFFLVSIVIVGGFGLLYTGRDGFGIAAVVTGLGSMVGVVVYGRESQKRERIEKDKNSK